MSAERYRIYQNKFGFHAQKWYDIEVKYGFWDKVFGCTDVSVHGFETMDMYGQRWRPVMNNIFPDPPHAIFGTEKEARDFIEELKNPINKVICEL